MFHSHVNSKVDNRYKYFDLMSDSTYVIVFVVSNSIDIFSWISYLIEFVRLFRCKIFSIIYVKRGSKKI